MSTNENDDRLIIEATPDELAVLREHVNENRRAMGLPPMEAAPDYFSEFTADYKIEGSDRYYLGLAWMQGDGNEGDRYEAFGLLLGIGERMARGEVWRDTGDGFITRHDGERFPADRHVYDLMEWEQANPAPVWENKRSADLHYGEAAFDPEAPDSDAITFAIPGGMRVRTSAAEARRLARNLLDAANAAEVKP